MPRNSHGTPHPGARYQVLDLRLLMHLFCLSVLPTGFFVHETSKRPLSWAEVIGTRLLSLASSLFSASSST